MYKRILVPTDGSASSRLALQHGIKLAKLTKAEIILLHITFTPQAYWGNNLAYGITISEEEMQKLGEDVVEETMRSIDFEGVPIKKRITSGSPAQSIIDIANQEHIDLIIMGSHGHGPFSGAFLGSVSQRVLAKVSCPVMVMKDAETLE